MARCVILPPERNLGSRRSSRRCISLNGWQGPNSPRRRLRPQTAAWTVASSISGLPHRGGTMENRRPVSFSVQTQNIDLLATAEERLEWNLPGTLVWGQQRKHFQMTFKRILDVLVSFTLLFFLAIPLTIVAIAIKIDSPGPVFYPHERVGHNGRRFRMYKFRSMVVDAEEAKQGLLLQNET